MIKSTVSRIGFELVLKADGGEGTALTPSVEFSLDGSAIAAVAGAVAELGKGAYSVPIAAVENNGGHLLVIVTEGTCVPQSLNVYPTDPALFKADVSGNATAVELAKVIKSGEAANYVSTGEPGGIDVTATRV